jgi:hypothetical protein
MQRDDFKEFSEILMQLCDAFGKEYTVSRGKAYWLALSDLTLEEFRRAAVTCLRECRFMPVPVEIREGVDHIPAGERALLAYGVVREKVRVISADESVDFDDVLINAVINKTGGWVELTRRTGPQLDMFQRSFVELYKCYMKNGITSEDGRHCRGVEEARNRHLMETGQWELRVRRFDTGLPPHRNGLVRPSVGNLLHKSENSEMKQLN